MWTPVAIEQWVTSEGGDADKEEPLGTKEKFWVTDPGSARWLFKYARDSDGRVRDEDRAECLVRVLAGLLRVPTAEVRLATCDAQRGVISLSIVPPGQRLEHGNELLAATLPGYDPTAQRENVNYTVEAVRAALNDVGPPLSDTAHCRISRDSRCGPGTRCLTRGSAAATAIMRTGGRFSMAPPGDSHRRSITAMPSVFRSLIGGVQSLRAMRPECRSGLGRETAITSRGVPLLSLSPVMRCANAGNQPEITGLTSSSRLHPR